MESTLTGGSHDRLSIFPLHWNDCNLPHRIAGGPSSVYRHEGNCTITYCEGFVRCFSIIYSLATCCSLSGKADGQAFEEIAMAEHYLWLSDWLNLPGWLTVWNPLRVVHRYRGKDNSVGRAANWNVWLNTDAGSSFRGGKGFFSRRQLPVQTLLRCLYSPRVQSHALTSARTLKIPSTSSHTTVWTYENTAQTEGMGIALLLRLLCLSKVRRPEFPKRDNINEVLKICTYWVCPETE